MQNQQQRVNHANRDSGHNLMAQNDPQDQTGAGMLGNAPVAMAPNPSRLKNQNDAVNVADI